ncbi:sensor histidine kinase [Microbacterium sp. NPDC055903]
MIAFVVILGVITAFDLFRLFSSPGQDPGPTLLSIASTAVFALFLWSPLAAVCAIAVIFGLSFIVDSQIEVLAAAAVAAGLVLRLGWNALILAYAGAFLVATAIIAIGDSVFPGEIAIYLIFAAVAGGIGLALRVAFDRGSRLERELEQRAEQERQAVLAERRWIAGELHDSIAHHLTVVSLHVQLLDDPTMSTESQDAIRIAARKAMTDLRFVIELADDGPRSEGMQTGDLASSIEEASAEFASAGHAVRREGDPRDDRIPRMAEIILARIMRESATNVLKYAGPGEVTIALSVDDAASTLVVSSPLPTTPRRDLPSSSTGLRRMADRVLGASGDFSAGEVDGQWRVAATVPIT